MILKRTVAPLVEPVTVAEARQHVGDVPDEWVGKLTADIEGARQQVENDTGRALITQTWTGKLDRWPCCDEIKIPLGPVASISGITYRLADGVTVLTLPTTVYDLDPDSDVPRIFLRYGQQWPSEDLHPKAAITITLLAGYGASGDFVPMPLRQALLLLVGHRLENREAVTIGNTAIDSKYLECGYWSLLEPYRLRAF